MTFAEDKSFHLIMQERPQLSYKVCQKLIVSTLPELTVNIMFCMLLTVNHGALGPTRVLLCIAVCVAKMTRTSDHNQ